MSAYRGCTSGCLNLVVYLLLGIIVFGCIVTSVFDFIKSVIMKGIVPVFIFLLLLMFNGCVAFGQSAYNPYAFQPIDTVFRYIKQGEDSFAIRYVYGISYVSTAVGRMKCNKDSNGKMKCVEDIEFYNADRHYFSHIQVFQIVSCKCFLRGFDTIPIGKEMNGYYVPHGCYEDVPKLWVEKAFKQ